MGNFGTTNFGTHGFGLGFGDSHNFGPHNFGPNNFNAKNSVIKIINEVLQIPELITNLHKKALKGYRIFADFVNPKRGSEL